MTSWIPTFQYSERIGSVKEIVKVLQDGADGSNLRGREKGDDPIPKSFVQFELKPPPASAHLVQLAHIKAIQCVTHIPQLKSRHRRNHSGFYINVHSWVYKKKGKAILPKNVRKGFKARLWQRHKESLEILLKKHKF